MSRPLLALLILGTLLCHACRQDSSAPAPAPREPNAALALTDWVAHPRLVLNDGTTDLRIISAAPNVTEICCALGLADQLVGRTRYCTYPPAVHDVTDIGTLVDMSVETVVGLRPDLVLVAGESRQILDRFTQAGLRVESLPDDSLADLFDAIARVGRLTGREQTAAALANGIRADLQRVLAHHADTKRRRVLLLTGPLATPPAPPFVAGPGSFYDELLRHAGHANAAPADAPPFGPLALEALLATRPDVIIELVPEPAQRPDGDASALAAWQPFQQLDAVRDGRVRIIPGGQHFVLGPRIAETLAALCEAIESDHGG